MYKQKSWSPNTYRDEAWQRRKGNDGLRCTQRTKSVTDEDLEKLKVCIELGFGFDSPEMDQHLSDTLSVDGLYYAVYYAASSITDGWLFFATKLVNPFFAFLDPEVAHRLVVSAAARGWVPREKRLDPSILRVELWGKRFCNSIGLSAGFDKNAEAVEGLLGLGFGFVEVGSVTPAPQEGNPKPCIFPLPKEGAIINRCGFNSEGIVVVAKRLGAQHGKRKLETSSTSSPTEDDVKQGGKAGPAILGVNLGKNKTSEDAAANYVQGVHTLSQYADYLGFKNYLTPVNLSLWNVGYCKSLNCKLKICFCPMRRTRSCSGKEKF